MVKVKMAILKVCKNSIRYVPVDEAGIDVCSSVYIMNPSIEILGKPEYINLTIEKAEN